MIQTKAKNKHVHAIFGGGGLEYIIRSNKTLSSDSVTTTMTTESSSDASRLSYTTTNTSISFSVGCSLTGFGRLPINRGKDCCQPTYFLLIGTASDNTCQGATVPSNDLGRAVITTDPSSHLVSTSH